MIAERITPRVVLLGLVLNAGAWLGLHLPVLFGGMPHRQETSELYFFGATEAVGYALAFLLYAAASREYSHDKWMRWGWRFVAANALVSIGRNTISTPLLNSVWPGYLDSPLSEFHHRVVIFIANSFLLLGLLSLWWGYQRVGLGFRIGRRVYAEIALILVLMLALIFSVRGDPTGLMVLSAAAVASVVLYDMAVQMGGGKLAVSLRLLTFYALLRATLVLIEVPLGLSMPWDRQTHDIILTLDLLCWRTVPWILALSAAYRAELTVHAKKALERQRAARSETAVAATA